MGDVSSAAGDRSLDARVAAELFVIAPRQVRVRGSDELVEVWTANPALSDGVWEKAELIVFGACPAYSAGWAGAGLVADEMRRRGWRFSIQEDPAGFDIRFWKCATAVHQAHGSSIGVAVARAALKAVAAEKGRAT